MSKAILGYMAAIALSLTATAFMLKSPSSTTAKAKETVKSQVEARKQALAET